jgi:hypothetical protein
LNKSFSHELFARGYQIAGIEGICGVCSWVSGHCVGPGGIANDKPVLAFGDCTCQMAILLSLSVVMGLCHGDDSAKLVLKFVDGLRGDHTIEASQFVPSLMSILYTLLDAEEDIFEVDWHDK